MTERTWGYAGQVGEWLGTISIPALQRRPPIRAAFWAIEQLTPIVRELHRPCLILVSWAVYDDQGAEIEFHELDELAVGSWNEIPSNLNQLVAQAGGTFALSTLFIKLDTAVIEADSVSWIDSSAELQISFPNPELTPELAGVRYATYIDAWLSTTYDEQYTARKNTAADRNRPRLEAVLREFSAVTGESYAVGQSQLYYDAITATGFRDFNLLPPLSPE